MKIEEIVGQRIRERREQLALSQAMLGKLIGEHLGRDWPRQAVSAAEKGDRQFGIAEMVAFAHVLGVSIAHLITPPADVAAVQLAPGVSCERDVVIQAVIPLMAADKPLDRELVDAYSQLLLHSRQLSRAADGLQEDMERIQQVAMAQQQRERQEGEG